MAENSEGESFLDDTYASARELITERFSSPFIFSFVISWLIFNYKIVILALTDSSEKLPVIDKIDSIQSYLHSSTFTIPIIHYPILLNGFLWPLLAAAFYTFVYPFADYLITKFTTSRKVAIRNMRVEKEEKIFYRFKDVQKIYIKHAEDDKNSRERIERAEITEAQQNAVIKNLQEKLNKVENNKNSIPVIKTQEVSSEVETKLALAKAYVEMEDKRGAAELLNEIMPIADTSQRRRAKRLINKLEKEKISTDKVSPVVKQAIGATKNTEIPQNEIDIIVLLARANDSLIEWVSEKEILKIKGKTATDIKIALNDSITKGLIKKDYISSIHGYGYQLTIDGMKTYKKLVI